MHNIHEVLERFKKYLDSTSSVEQIEDLLEILDDPATAAESESQPKLTLEDLLVVKTARLNADVLNELLELCTECRTTRLEGGSLDNPLDSWKHFSTFIVPDQLLAYFYCLIELASKDIRCLNSRNLSLTAGRAYILLLTSPGAKAFGAFNSNLIQKSIQLLGLLKILLATNIPNNEKINFQIKCNTFLEDLILLLKHVSFEENEEIKKSLVIAIAAVMELFYENKNSSKYLLDINENCYTVLENLCNPVQGEIFDSLCIILNGTAKLIAYEKSPTSLSSNPKYKSICYWFIDMLDKYPNQTVEVLTRYIQAILTDPELSASNQMSRNLDVCVLYESAMFSKCNKSIIEFLLELGNSSDTTHRTNYVEIISRMLLVNSESDWNLFPEELSKIPREIYLLKYLVEKITDLSNTIKVKAINGFLRVASNGSKRAMDILKELLKTEQEFLIFEENTTTPRFNGLEELGDIQEKLLIIVKWNLKSCSALVRKATLQLLEYLSTTLVNIDELIMSQEFLKLHADVSSLVRRQLMLCVEHILTANSTNTKAINAYVRITLDMANDSDTKVMETVMDSFKRKIFDNIERYEKSSSEKQLFPWRLLQAMLCCKDSPDLQKCINKWISKKLLTNETLSRIETHINTANSTEAWILLSMIARNIKSRNPEIVVNELMSNLKSDVSSNAVDNSYYQLEVLFWWLPDLNRHSQNEIFRIFKELLKSGGIIPRDVSRVYEICTRICLNAGEEEKTRWITHIEGISEEYILTHRNSLIISELYNQQLICYLYVYSEAITDLPHRPNQQIVQFLCEYLKDVANKKVQHDKSCTLKVNCIQNVLTRLALFDQDICLTIVPILGDILSLLNESSVIITAIKCLGDLCKRHTSSVEVVLPYILTKTKHVYHVVRKCALKNIASLILDDFLKFRGSILVYILAAILDEKEDISELARELLTKHTLEKNELLFRSCILECPFVFNDFLYFDNFEIFSASEVCLDSPLKGEDNRKGREYIYRYFVHCIDTIHLYLYFGNIHMIYDKVTNDTLMKTGEGVDAIKDFLYICAHICRSREKPKAKQSEGVNGDNESDEETAIAQVETTTISKRNKGPTMPQALTVVEKVIAIISKLSAKLLDMDESFQHYIDQMCESICIHFETLTEFAQPQDFWSKYKKEKSVPISKKKINKAVRKSIEAVDPVNGGADDAIAGPSTSQPTTPKNKKSQIVNSFSSSEETSDEEIIATTKLRLLRKRTNIS